MPNGIDPMKGIWDHVMRDTNRYLGSNIGVSSPWARLRPDNVGMPSNLATIAQKNLTSADSQINRFNFSASFNSQPSVSAPAPTNQRVSTPSLASQIQSYRPPQGAYNQIASRFGWASGY